MDVDIDVVVEVTLSVVLDSIDSIDIDNIDNLDDGLDNIGDDIDNLGIDDNIGGDDGSHDNSNDIGGDDIGEDLAEHHERLLPQALPTNNTQKKRPFETRKLSPPSPTILHRSVAH